MVAKLWASRGSTSTGPPADTDQPPPPSDPQPYSDELVRITGLQASAASHAAPSEVIYKNHDRSQPPPPSDPQPYSDELVRITGLQASAASPYIVMFSYLYIYAFVVRISDIHHPTRDPTQTNWYGSRAFRLQPPTPTKNKI